MHVEPQQEHHWLRRMLGEWTFEIEAVAGPDAPPERHTGTERVRPLGDVWVLCEGQGQREGEGEGEGTGRTVMTLGYDPARGRYVGTFIGSMMTHLWLYEGQLDASRGTLTLDTEGPRFSPEGGTARYRDVVAFRGDDERTLTSSMLGDDGEWRTFMTATYRRTSPTA